MAICCGPALAGVGTHGGIAVDVRRIYWAVLRHLPVSVRRHVQYTKAHRRRLHLRAPKRFSEKVNWRIAHDRRPVIEWTCDKLRMKKAAEVAGLRVPRTIWSGVDVAEILDLDLPTRWVLKPNHRTGLVHLGEGPPTEELLEAATSGWLKETQSDLRGEWAYSQATPCLLVEEWVGPTDEVPADYKLFVFDGVPHVIQVDTNRFSGHQRRFYRPDWTPLDVKHTFPLAPVEPAPDLLDDMLDAAAKLGAEFDFIRVDLYVTPTALYFGEVTPYPGGGLERFEPRWLDQELGEAWTLPEV